MAEQAIKPDMAKRLQSALEQFKGLDPNKPENWPLLPKLAVGGLLALSTLVGIYFLVLSDEQARLESEIANEEKLKADFVAKAATAANLPELRKQKSQVEEYVSQLEKQLPAKAEMDALLSDINQAGVGRGLQFELFKPSSEVIKDYYAEQPIALKVAGRYHDFGAFVSDVSNLSRIVTLHNFQIAPYQAKDPGGLLMMESIARTYRYLDPSEVAQAAKAKAAAKAAGAKK
ncbi:type IV pilus inner membrane component PilO [Inhella gelatinilytica]|uniref:Type 4a pilus biogenesis protein PilO n=1 Tax=Inhella gelatinilytica TaxID=2795030 RepID=A0A931IUK5_9BURK|nr:type 4a pilus biogenesis protein PilO [Inhella gelatinilytica]MBH9552429.1 type 4a pilus biogenesis protein PilO [Inhella gelatinilytica]